MAADFCPSAAADGNSLTERKTRLPREGPDGGAFRQKKEIKMFRSGKSELFGLIVILGGLQGATAPTGSAGDAAPRGSSTLAAGESRLVESAAGKSAIGAMPVEVDHTRYQRRDGRWRLVDSVSELPYV
jgi:hypothetical protein